MTFFSEILSFQDGWRQWMCFIAMKWVFVFLYLNMTFWEPSSCYYKYFVSFQVRHWDDLAAQRRVKVHISFFFNVNSVNPNFSFLTAVPLEIRDISIGKLSDPPVSSFMFRSHQNPCQWPERCHRNFPARYGTHHEVCIGRLTYSGQHETKV